MSQSDSSAPNSKLSVIIEELDHATLLTLRGAIDEDSDFSRLDSAKNKNLIFDLGGIELVNSVGIRSWVNWMKANRERIFTFRNCSKPIADQINVLEGFLPKASTVESFYVPYACENCDKGHDVLYRRGVEFEQATADKASVLTHPRVVCESCGREMEPEIIEAKYFRFLKYR